MSDAERLADLLKRTLGSVAQLLDAIHAGVDFRDAGGFRIVCGETARRIRDIIGSDACHPSNSNRLS